uniref:Pleckstrin n=1 Tax=Equus caballus TaxID=9796 RepID=A0A3Q2HN26_HORSE
MEPKRIREGYLVKRGSVFNTWKPMWVVLLEDGIEFYKKKSDNSPKGMIPLKGSTLTSPCQDFGKRMFVFKITTTKQQDHFFQAAFLEERDAWVRDIKKAIKCIEGGQKFARKSTRRSIRLPETIDLGALYLSMKDAEKGVKELNLEKDKKIFNHCFTGNCVIDWLVSNQSVRNRQEGLMVASSLLSEGYLQPAGELSKNAADGIAENPFLDNPDAFYYFPDSGFFCEENSSDDDVILKEEFRGVIIKQGCLLKQARRVKKRTSLRSSRRMKFIISCKRPPPRSAPSGSKPSRWPLGLGSEGTPAAPHHPPKGTPRINSVQGLSTSGDKSTRTGPGVGNFHLQGFRM